MAMQQLERPRFRQDLVAEPVDDAGARFVDVMDPDSGSVFRFFEVEYSIACAMDGDRDVAGLVRWASEELGVTPSPNEVQSVIATLGQLGYLDGGARAAASAPVAAPVSAPVAAAPTAVSAPITKPEKPAKPAPAETFIGAGIVVGPKPVHTPVPSLELGHVSAPAATAKSTPSSEPAIELVSGVSVAQVAAAPAAKPAPIHDLALGASGRGEMSTDLSEQVGIGVEDVKEAVRASQVMKAVDVPPELAAALEDSPPPAKLPTAAPTPTPAAAPVVAPAPVAAKAPEPIKPAPVAKAPEPVKPAVAPVAAVSAKEPPKPVAKPVEADRKVSAPPAPEPRTSRTLIGLLVIVILGGAAFFAYRFIMSSEDTNESNVTPPKTTKVEPPPAAPKVELVKLATSPERTVELKPLTAGQIDTLTADGPVAAGDVVATLVGGKQIQTEIDAIQKDIDKRVKVELDQAKKDQQAAHDAGNKAAETAAAARVTDRQKSLTDKQNKIAARGADLAKLQVRATSAGVLASKAKVGDKVATTDVVSTVTHKAVRTATFTRTSTDAQTGSAVTLATKAGQSLTCTVSASDPKAVAVECPTDAAADGTEVSLGAAAAAATGSATTGSAATGSADATGSAAAPSPAAATGSAQ